MMKTPEEEQIRNKRSRSRQAAYDLVSGDNELQRQQKVNVMKNKQISQKRNQRDIKTKYNEQFLSGPWNKRIIFKLEGQLVKFAFLIVFHNTINQRRFQTLIQCNCLYRKKMGKCFWNCQVQFLFCSQKSLFRAPVGLSCSLNPPKTQFTGALTC